MRRLFAVMRKRRAVLVGYGLAFLLMMLLSACGNGSDSGDISLDSSSSGSETGSADIKILWYDAATAKEAVEPLAEESLDCETAGVATITCKVYNDANTLLTTGDAWPCSAHSGTMDEIPVGENRTFVILAADDEGNIVYQGQKANINIEERPDNEVGAIAAYAFVPQGLTATPQSAVQIDLAWTQPNEAVPPAGYRIYRDGVQLDTSASTSYSDTKLTQNTEYCYTVEAYDIFGNASGPVTQVCATTEVSDDQEAPSVPAGLTAQAVSASQIDLAWTESIDNVGVSEYRISRNGDQIGTSASPSYSDTGLTQNTEYCYTVEAYDAVGNPSGASEQACATTPESFDWYRDNDSDSYGDPTDTIAAETQPQGYVSDNTDCDDTAPSVHPGATEVCNSIDDNCDGQVDEGVQTTYYRDADSDGFGDANNPTQACELPPAGYVADSSDCNDDNVNVNPNAGETCNEIDDNCNGEVDEGVQTTYYSDADSDGFGDANNPIQACEPPAGYVADTSDCNDDDASVNPNAAETCNEIDDNCDGNVDEGLTFDVDADGYSSPDSCQGTRDDCDDTNGSINPGALEICGDDIDNNCNEQIDENCIIDVDIDNDFEYVADGWPMGLSVGQTSASRLRTNPYENLIPPSDTNGLSLYGYGYLTLGNSADDQISFAIFSFAWTEFFRWYYFYVDLNNNEDLTDDGGLISNEGTGRLAALISLNVDVIDDSGNSITRPYRLWMWLDDDDNVRFYARCHYSAEINIGTESYTAVAFEYSNHDALYRESGLYIDLNRDGALDENTENFGDQTMITINGQEYELLLNYP